MSQSEAPPQDPELALALELERRERKRQKKAQRAIVDTQRPLDAWERYHALADTFEMEQDLVDLADHKARFALLIMGTLNAVTFIVGSRPEAIAMVPPDERIWLSAFLGLYALLALFFFLQAIESLRPREAKPNVRYPGEAGREDYPSGLRFFADVLQRDVNAYRAEWRNVHLGQLNAEVAMQVHALAGINKTKYGALQRLYVGLRAMTLMTAAMLTALALLAFARSSEGAEPAPREARATGKKGEKKTQAPGVQLLKEPQRVAVANVAEPSGIAFHAKSGHLFVVGDEGSLAEITTAGKAIWSQGGFANLEDVAVHTPSGNLVLLSERRAELVLFDPGARKELRTFKLDKKALLGKHGGGGDTNVGFEGLSFREEKGRPGGGVFYLTHQRSPALVIELAFDVEQHGKKIGAEDVIASFKIPDYDDLTAVTYVPELQRLLVISERKDRLLVLRRGGGLESEIVLPGTQQEGIAFDGRGNLWIADDRGGLLRFDGALAALESQRGTKDEPEEEQR